MWFVARKTVTETDPNVSLSQHLMQRGGRWYFNRAWPTELRGALGAAPFRVSLHTDSLKEARRARPEAERRYWAKVDAARAKPSEAPSRPLSEAAAQSLAVEWFREELGKIEAILAEVQSYEPHARLAHEQAPDQLAELRRELGEADLHHAWKIARPLAQGAGYAKATQELARLVQRARIAWHEVWQGRLVADYSARPSEPLFAAALETPQGAPEALPPARPATNP